jgi:hypothetical protein
MKTVAFSWKQALYRELAKLAIGILAIIGFFGSLYVSAKFQEGANSVLIEIHREDEVSSPPPDPDPEQQPVITGVSAVIEMGYDRNLPLLF